MPLSSALMNVLSNQPDPVTLVWLPSGAKTFVAFQDWHDSVMALSLHPSVPGIVRAKYQRAQRLYLLAWIEGDLIKPGELLAFAALELALQDRYGEVAKSDKQREKGKKPTLAQLLNYAVEKDGMTDDDFLSVKSLGKFGGSAMPQITGKLRLSLAEIRNGLAHGDPFDALPWGGLLHVIRDIISYAYRKMISATPD